MTTATHRRPSDTELAAIADALLAIEAAAGRENALARWARTVPSIARALRRLEAERLGELLVGQPQGVQQRLIAARAGRSTRTVRRWRQNATLHHS